MKKLFIVFAVAIFFVAGVFAQDDTNDKALRAEIANSASPDTTTRSIEIEDIYKDIHPKAMTVKLEVQYTPLTNEVKFFYTCMAASYDQGEALDTATAVITDFMKENQYTRFTYRAKDKTKYFKDNRNIKMATYVSSILLIR